MMGEMDRQICDFLWPVLPHFSEPSRTFFLGRKKLVNGNAREQELNKVSEADSDTETTHAVPLHTQRWMLPGADRQQAIGSL